MRLFQEDNVWEAIKGLNLEGAPCPNDFLGFIFNELLKIIKTSHAHIERNSKKLWHEEN